MQSIRIVTHCHAVNLPQYAVFLQYHLASLAKCSGNVSATVCYVPEDFKTSVALNWFSHNFPDFPLQKIGMTPGELFRRSIGRNLAARDSHEELVWFADVDHIFLADCFDQLFSAWNELPEPKPAMVYPGTIKIHATHELGDELVRTYEPGGDLRIDPADFVDKHYNRAIGVVQIVAGTVAKVYGYLDGSKKYQEPTDGKHPFPSFRDDIAYRSFFRMMGGVQKVEFDGVYRLRHSMKTY